jgi:MEMO1 family protein
MTAMRPAVVAGKFYPGAPRVLQADVRTYVGDATARLPQRTAQPKAVIVPHAGYVYSGAVAGSAYARLAAGRDVIRRVVLFGPTHRVPVRGLALPSARAFSTPLGDIDVDREAAAAALALPCVCESDAAHAFEHSLEVQLPFLQEVLGEFTIVPFAVGDATPREVADVMRLLWGGPETLIVVSSDLSHYHGYAEARAIDRATADAVLALSPKLDHEQACGATPINGLLLCVREHGLRPELLDLRNSGDTAGDKSRVVGYASFAFAGGADAGT